MIPRYQRSYRAYDAMSLQGTFETRPVAIGGKADIPRKTMSAALDARRPPTEILRACDRSASYNAAMTQSRSYLTGALATLGLVSSAGAVFAASCCVLPLVLGGLGLGAGLFSALELLADYRTPILLFSAGLIAVAWGVYFRRRGARSTAAVLAAASVLVVAAANWDTLERPLLRVVRANR